MDMCRRMKLSDEDGYCINLKYPEKKCAAEYSLRGRLGDGGRSKGESFAVRRAEGLETRVKGMELHRLGIRVTGEGVEAGKMFHYEDEKV